MVDILIDIFLGFGIASAAIVLLAAVFYGLALVAMWMTEK